MTMPNFLIVGAAKSGTTSLYHYARQHPEIYMSSVKEPKFFALEGEELDFRGPGDRKTIQKTAWITDLAEYSELFREITDETAIGEASSLYLYNPRAAARIRHYLPQVKLIAILRDPTERAYSNFLYMTRLGREPLTDFAEALRHEEKRICNNWMPTWHYKERGFYYTQLRRYFDEFPSSQIKVYLFEDLVADPHGLLRDLFQFLGVDPTFTADVSTRHNPSGMPKSRTLHSFLAGRNPIKTAIKAVVPSGFGKQAMLRLRNQNLTRTPVPPETRSMLIDVCRHDILKLQDLLQRDLASWLE